MCENKITKDEIRKVIRQKRDSLSKDDLINKSRKIFEKLVASEIYKISDNILIYASMGSEVRTDEIIEDALKQGKNVFCPKCVDTKNGLMEFIKISDISQLIEGYYGIREPVLAENSVVYDNIDTTNNRSDDLMIMPLVAFDAQNNRIGYKGGYYDRYLEKNPYINTCALAFEIQKSETTIPSEAHDIKPQRIITEEV